MKTEKKNIKILITTVTVITIIILLIALGTEIKHKIVIEDNSRELPDLTLKYLNGKTISSKSFSGKVVLVFFNSTCEHCRAELNDFEKVSSQLKKVTIALISSESMAEINDFSKATGLIDKPNFFFYQVTPQQLYENFGTVTYPEIYIYNNQSLVKHFKGETKIEVILRHLNSI
ncbi:MAG TPA: TlpA disulfide reductase family protein [Cellvibrio sp.]